MTSARDLATRLSELLHREHAAMGDFLVALADFDRRRLWVDLGHASLFAFLHRDLGLSNASAFYRKTAAELIQRFPEVVEPLRDGRLCLTSIVELSKVLTPENQGEVLPRFFHLSKREAKAAAAEIRPDEAPPRREVVTALSLPPVARALALQTPEPALRPDEVGRASPQGSNGEPPPATPPARTPTTTSEPLTADLNRFHVTVSRRFLEKLETAKAALSHSHPGAGADEILEAGLDLLLERAAKRRGLVSNPRPPHEAKAPPGSKRPTAYIPAHVRRAVWKRDGGRCQWPMEGGGVCGSTHCLEIDHIKPRALGGPSTIENCRVACAFHNGLAARRVFGDAWMDRFSTRKRATITRGGEP